MVGKQLTIPSTLSRERDMEKALAKTEYMKSKLLMYEAAVAYYRQAIAERLRVRLCAMEGCGRKVHGAKNKRYCSYACQNTQSSRRTLGVNRRMPLW